jgi:hypothetical protein
VIEGVGLSANLNLQAHVFDLEIMSSEPNCKLEKKGDAYWCRNEPEPTNYCGTSHGKDRGNADPPNANAWTDEGNSIDNEYGPERRRDWLQDYWCKDESKRSAAGVS